MARSESAAQPECPSGQARFEVVYCRTEPGGAIIPNTPPANGRPRVGEIAPAITPLVIGFTLLLALISILGYLSVQRMNDVSNTVISLEQQHTARLRLLLSLRLAVTKLNNEARRREELEARRQLNHL